MALKLNYLKTLKVLSKNPRLKLVKFRILYITPMPSIAEVQILETESIYDTPPHSAWSESSAARPTARGGRRGSEKVAPGAFAMLQRRGP